MSYNRTGVFEKRVSRAKKVFQVGDDYRTNPESRRPGGSSVKVLYHDGTSRVYDKIKNVAAYTRYILNNSDGDIKEVCEI